MLTSSLFSKPFFPVLLLVRDATVVADANVHIGGAGSSCYDVEGVIDDVGDSSSVGRIELDLDGYLEVDGPLEVTDQPGLVSIEASNSGLIHSEVWILERNFLVLQDSEPPKVVWVLVRIDGGSSIRSIVHQCRCSHLSGIGLHVLNQHKADLIGIIRSIPGSCSLKGGCDKLTADLDLTNKNRAANALV